MEKELAENLPIRKKLLDIIRNKPGIHFRKIHRETDVAMGELEYHLQVLEKLELVSKIITKGYSRYYPAYELGTHDKKIMGQLRQERLREIILFILSSNQPSHKDIASHFILLKSTTSFYMDKLLGSGIVIKKKEGRRVIYEIKEPQKILRLILLYKEGFGDEIVKRVEDLWSNL
jgi:predicted transcriptional regulator